MKAGAAEHGYGYRKASQSHTGDHLCRCVPVEFDARPSDRRNREQGGCGAQSKSPYKKEAHFGDGGSVDADLPAQGNQVDRHPHKQSCAHHKPQDGGGTAQVHQQPREGQSSDGHQEGPLPLLAEIDVKICDVSLAYLPDQKAQGRYQGQEDID